MSFNDLSGQLFGKLLVLERAEDHISSSGRREVQYKCLCECGTTKVVKRKSLMNGHAKTCGSKIHKESAPEIICCVHNPCIDCQALNCDKCGWNPDNIELRKARINRLQGKDGIDK